jgi:integrase
MQPLLPDAHDTLLQAKASCGAEPYQRVFAGLIPRIERFKKDLKAAGIPYQDARGEYADFHSLRKTFGTMLTLAGVGLRTVMELMRHSDMRLTAKTYIDANMLPVSDAMVSLTAIHLSSGRHTNRRTKFSQSRSRGVNACPDRREKNNVVSCWGTGF